MSAIFLFEKKNKKKGKSFLFYKEKKNNNMSKCGKTVTARLARTKLFSEQIISMSLFILQLIKKIIENFIIEHELPAPTQVSEWRLLLISVRSDLNTYNNFYNKISERYKHIVEIISMAIDSHAVLVGLEDDIVAVNDPVHALWLYILKIMYISPFLIMREDDEDGKAIKTLNKALKKFAQQTITLKFNKTYLNSDNLQKYNDNDDENDIDEHKDEQNTSKQYKRLYLEDILPSMKINV
jgi:hypothetical protein